MTGELISVIVPIYNVEKYIHKSIDSILNQTYTNLEIILVDDGGMDHCPAICDDYARKDRRIKVIHKENGGLSDARNAGVRIAQGAYIGFVDSDDFIKPDMYEKMLTRLKETGADIAVCNYACVRTDGTLIEERNRNASVVDEVFDTRQAVEQLCGPDYAYWVTAWNRLYKADIAKAVSFPTGKIHEDEFTAHLFYDRAEKVAGLSEPLYQYVIREDSIMTKKYSIRNLDYVEALNQRIGYCMEHEMRTVGLAFLRWMGKYLIKAASQLDMKDTEAALAFRSKEELFWKTYKEIKRKYGVDQKTLLIAMVMRMPKKAAKLVVG